MFRFAVICVISALVLASAAAKRPVTAEDYYRFSSIPEARISPDGRSVAYVVTTVDAKRNRRESSIWLLPLAGNSAPRQLTTGASARSPRWSPDGGVLAFLAVRPTPAGPYADRPQLYLLPMNGGEPRRITALEHGVEAFNWSPRGDRFVCVSKTGPSRPAFDDGGSDVRYYTSLSYKYNDTGFYDDRRAHLFVVDVKTGKATQITSGATRNDADPQWSPDGTKIAFASEDSDKPVLMNNDIWVVSASGGELKRINAKSEAAHLPRWSPDGGRIAYVASPDESNPQKLWIAPAEGGAPVLASRELDTPPLEMHWSAPNAIEFEGAWHGETHVYRLDPATGHFAALTSGPRDCVRMDLNSRAHEMVHVVNDFKHPDELYTADENGRGERKLTNVNAWASEHLDMQDVARVSFKGAGGWYVEGFFVKPLGWQAGKSYPMVLSIHGGPASMYGVNWYHEFQMYASRGWAVFFANPRGSSGYGTKFQRGVNLNWGGTAYEDLMAGVDAVLAKYPWIDRTRLGVTGGSYGGFMTNWIVSHTNRFRAAVTLRSISNFMSVEGTRDAAYSHAHDFGGDLFENPDYYWKSSPLKYAANVKTPTLILHSDGDLRVPLEQGEQWFRALKHFGVTAEFVIFPRDNHNLTRTGEPRHLVESLNWQLYWFDRFLDGKANAVPPARAKAMLAVE